MPHWETEEAHGNTTEPNPGFVCHFPGCRRDSKPFKHKGDLTRHRKQHDGGSRVSCTAQGCRYSFTRNDKLLDHVHRGHDEETLFACSTPGCHAFFTRDYLPLHSKEYCMSPYDGLERHRQCPLPRCGFRASSFLLDELRQHLLEKHDAKGRERFASALAERGYDHESATVICPLCPDTDGFEAHQDFYEHFLVYHSPHPQTPTKSKLNSLIGDLAGGVFYYWRQCSAIPHGVREHRRVLLSLWPDFKYHPVCDDVKRCPARGIP